MMIDNISKLKKASDNYILNNDYEITERLLTYIQERISANKKEIEELIDIRKENITYEDIENVIKDEISQDIKYKNYKKMYINKDKFISTSLLMPVGTIAVEAFDTIEAIRYFIKAIKSRNSIAISDVEYDEQSVKFLVLAIIKEALKKFNIDENLIMILPYEECFYDYFDKIIYTYNKTGEKLSENKYENKEITDKKYIYIENKELEENAINDNPQEKELLYGELEKTIEKINSSYSKAAIIYTKNPEIAYRFINLAHSKNVLVNASLQNVKDTNKSPDEMYEYKNIVLPIPREEIINEDENEDKPQEEMSLTVVNQSIFAKIKSWLRRIFG